MMNQLDVIEKRIRDLFESSTSILIGSDESAQFIHRLCESLQNYFLDLDEETQSVNPVFQITLNPVTLNHWKCHPDWEQILIEILTSTAAEFGIQYKSPPELSIVARNSVENGEVLVTVTVPSSSYTKTGAIPLQKGNIDHTPPTPTEVGSYLILKGDKIVPLSKSVINIGRKSSNQIIINDLRISRIHAQIRRIQGSYVIFDVGSTGGTYVNSTRINQHTLRPGDVISLAGYTMIYSEDQVIQSAETKEKTSEIKPQVQEENS